MGWAANSLIHGRLHLNERAVKGHRCKIFFDIDETAEFDLMEALKHIFECLRKIVRSYGTPLTWAGLRLFVLKNDEFGHKYHVISNVAEIFGGRAWTNLCTNIQSALGKKVPYDHPCLERGTLRLPYQHKDDGKFISRKAGIYRIHGFYDENKLTTQSPPNLDSFAYARCAMEQWSIFGLEGTIILSSLGGKENEVPVVRAPVPRRRSPPHSPIRAARPLAERSNSNIVEVDADREPDEEMTEVARKMFGYCRAMMDRIEKKSVDFEFGYRCNYPHLGNEAIGSIYADMMDLISTDNRWDSKSAEFKRSLVIAMNKHLCYNLSDNTIMYRTPVSTDSAYVALGKASVMAMKGYFSGYKIEFACPPSEKRPVGASREYPIFNIWLTSAIRQSIANILFVPYPEGHPKLKALLPSDCLNSYRGYRFTPEEMSAVWNPTIPTTKSFAARVSVARYLLHMCYVWCRGYVDRVSYALFWLAKKLQYPYWKPTTTMVLIGREGAGKTSQVDMYGFLFGTQHYFRWVNAARNIAGFSHPDQEFALFTLIDEANPVKDEQMQSQLRMLISDVNGTLHLKHKDEKKVANYSGYIFLSNNFHAVTVSASARRWCVFDCLTTLHPRDTRHQAYMSKVLELSNFPNHDGYKALGGFYMDKRIFTPETVEFFGDGSGLPPSIEKLLGTQRAMGQDSVGVYIYTVLDRGYFVPPEQNPLHPVNCGDEVSAAVAKISTVGYRVDIDYDCPVDGDSTPVHKTGRSWAHVLLCNTVYAAYRSWVTTNKAYTLGSLPDPPDRFWEKVRQILPSLRIDPKNRLRLAQECFMVSEARARWLPGFSGDAYSTVHHKVERDHGASRLIKNDYPFVVFSDLSLVRTEYIHNSGRNDVYFSDFNEGLVFMARKKDKEPKEYRRYDDPAEFLRRFGFNDAEIEATFPGRDITDVFLELGNTPTNIGRAVEAPLKESVTLPDIRNIGLEFEFDELFNDTFQSEVEQFSGGGTTNTPEQRGVWDGSGGESEEEANNDCSEELL